MLAAPYKEQLHSHGAFSEQVIAVLAGLGYRLEANKSDFVFLRIYKSDCKALTVALIDHDSWLLPNASLRYQIVYQHVSKLRREGSLAVIIWEDQWNRSREIVVSRIKALLGISVRIPARLTYTERIDKSTTDRFLNEHHLQGNVSSKYRYGLFLPVRYFRILPQDFEPGSSNQDLLVAVATFSNAKIFPRDGFTHRSSELIRYASFSGTTVIGAINKLIKAFVVDFRPNDIMTYADLEWSDGRSYEKLGFKYVSERESIRFYLDKEGKRQSTSDEIESGNTPHITNAGSKKFVKTIYH